MDTTSANCSGCTCFMRRGFSHVVVMLAAMFLLASSSWAQCGDPDAGGCFEPNGTPFCDDLECCENVCVQDAFCCETEWDAFCVTAAKTYCVKGKPCDVMCPPDAIQEEEPCGPDQLNGCGTGQEVEAISGGSVDVCGSLFASIDTGNPDAWRIGIPENGTLTVEVFCGLPTITQIVDDGCTTVLAEVTGNGCPNLVTLSVSAGWVNCQIGLNLFSQDACDGSTDYHARISFDGDGSGGGGDGCGDPLSGDCCNKKGTGTPYCNDAECCEVVCAIDAFCCENEWDPSCALQAATSCNCDGGGGNEGCGEAGTGNCCEATGTPYCDDQVCCDAICAADAFCCETEWDQICADAAAMSPDCDCGGGGDPACGGVGTGNCCEANSTPYCDDAACCDSVCAVEPFCCETEWDQECADLAADDDACNCGGGGGVENDDCSGAVEIFDGDRLFSTLDATVSGPDWDLPKECDGGFGTAFGPDIWFFYFPTCNGTLTVSTCNNADYDTRLAAYAECNPDTFLACNDDAPDCAGFTSLLQMQVQCNTMVLIRVGGFDTATGSGTITISCEGEDCGGGGPSCGDVNSGDCCEANGSPYCDDSECCEVVCNADPTCCDTEWDEMCAAMASESCDLCDSGTVCIADLNGDLIVDGADLGILLGAWTPNDLIADLNGDLIVDGADLGIMLGQWGPCKP